MLVTVANHKELWYVPPVHGTGPVEPTCVHQFADVPCGIVETDPDVFYLVSGNFYTTHEAYLHHLDLRGWTPGQPLKLETVFQFPDTARVTEQLIGPSSGVWGRGPGEEAGRIAYFLTDGGTASPPRTARHPAALLRVEFPRAAR